MTTQKRAITRDDILPLSEAFLAEIGRGLGTPPAGISRDARQRLLDGLR